LPSGATLGHFFEGIIVLATYVAIFIYTMIPHISIDGVSSRAPARSGSERPRTAQTRLFVAGKPPAIWGER